jgi:hypothetical protein
LAGLQATLYHLPEERFERHAAARAKAMLYRDQRGPSIQPADWKRIEAWLDDSWSSLHAAVR